MRIKRNLFILLLIILKTKSSIIFATEAFHTELYADSQKTLGSKVLTPFTEFRFGLNEEDMNYGLSLNTKAFLPALPIIFKSGNLSGGGALSKLSNPALTNSSSAFSTGISAVNELTASLPSYTSFSKDQSCFVQAEVPLKFKKKFEIKNLLNIWLTPELPSPIYSAAIKALADEKRLSLNLSAITGSFYYDEAKASSWISDQAYYKEGIHQCSLLQFSVSYKNRAASAISTTFAAGFYESPFGKLPLNLRADIDFKNREIELFTSAFYNPQEGLITSSDKYLSSMFQVKSGVINKKMLVPFGSPLFIKTAFNITGSFYFLASDQPFTANAGIQFSNSLAAFSLSASLKAKVPTARTSFLPSKPEFESLLLQAKTNWNLKFLSPSAAASLTLSEKDSETVQKYKFSLGLSHGKKYNAGGTLSYSFSASNKQISGKKLTAELTIKLTFPFLTILGKLSATLE